MNRHRLIKEVTWNSQLPGQELDLDLQRLQSASRLCCYIVRSGAFLSLWNDLVRAVKEKHQRHYLQTCLDRQLQDDQSSTLSPRTDFVLDVQVLLDSPLQELSLSGHLQFALMFPPLLPFLKDLTKLEMRLKETAMFPMLQVLTACPLLERIHFESMYKLILESTQFVNKPLLRLRSLVLFHVYFQSATLDHLLSNSPRLQEFKLHTWKNNTTIPIIFYSNQFNEFERARLRAFLGQQSSTTLTVNNGLSQQQSIEQQDLGEGSTMMLFNTMFSVSRVQALKMTPNVVTTLELRRDVTNTAVGLHEFLCNSRHLLHLLVPNTELSIHHLDIHQRLSDRWIHCDDNKNDRPRLSESQIWTCCNLRTLHLAFHSYASGRIEAPIISRLIFGYISQVCRQIQDLEIYGLNLFSLRSRSNKPSLCMRLEGGLCFLAELRQLRRLRVGSFDAKLQCAPSDLDWMVASGHTLAARKARRLTIAAWDTTLAEEAQEELIRLSKHGLFTIDPAPRTSIVAVVDQELESHLTNIGFLADVKTMLLEEMERSDFKTWPRLTKAGLYTDVDFLWPVREEYLRLMKDYI